MAGYKPVEQARPENGILTPHGHLRTEPGDSGRIVGNRRTGLIDSVATLPPLLGERMNGASLALRECQLARLRG